MDQHLILTAETLRLADDVHAGATVDGVFTLKYLPAGTYLHLTAAEYRMLRVFGSGAKVPNVLRELIVDRRCPPLSEFYELVLKARAAGVLRSEPETLSPPPPVLWWLRLRPWPFILFSVLLNFAALVLVFRTTIASPWHLRPLLGGWAAFCAAISIGYAFAASVIASAGFEVYRPHLQWRTLTPHFAVGLSDARMGNRTMQLGVWLARLFPPAATAGSLMYFYPAWSFLPVLGWLYMVRPFSGGSPARIRVIFLRGLKSDSQRNFIFEPNTTLLARWRAAWRTLQMRLAVAALLHSVIWLAAVLVWIQKWSGVRAVDWRLYLAGKFSPQVWVFFAAWIAGALLVWLALGAGASIVGPWRKFRAKVLLMWRRIKPYGKKLPNWRRLLRW